MAVEPTTDRSSDEPIDAFATRNARLNTACDLFNIAVPDWEIYGDPDAELTPDHVDYGERLTRFAGRCGPRANGCIYLRLDKNFITNTDKPLEKRLCLIIHEFAHAVDIPNGSDSWYRPGHGDDFYAAFASLTERVIKEKSRVESVLGTTVNWPQFIRAVTRNPKSHQVDRRSTTAYEQRRYLVNRLGTPDPLDPFSGMSMYRYLRSKNGDGELKEVPLNQIGFELQDVDDVMDWWRSQEQRKAIKTDGDRYLIYPLQVRAVSPDAYLAESDMVATVLYYSCGEDLTTEVPIEIL